MNNLLLRFIWFYLSFESREVTKKWKEYVVLVLASLDSFLLNILVVEVLQTLHSLFYLLEANVKSQQEKFFGRGNSAINQNQYY